MHLSFDRIILPTTIAQVGPAVLRQFVTTKAPDLNPMENGSGDDAAMMAAWFRGLPSEKYPALFEGLHAIGRVLGHEDAEVFLRGQQFPIAPTGTGLQIKQKKAAIPPSDELFLETACGDDTVPNDATVLVRKNDRFHSMPSRQYGGLGDAAVVQVRAVLCGFRPIVNAKIGSW